MKPTGAVWRGAAIRDAAAIRNAHRVPSRRSPGARRIEHSGLAKIRGEKHGGGMPCAGTRHGGWVSFFFFFFFFFF
jgi:hypothetical protein